MSQFYGKGMFPNGFSSVVMENEEAQACLIPMGITSENVAKKYGITREMQDAFGAESMQKAAKAQQEGLWKDEITPVKVTWTNPKTKEEEEIVVDKDDGIRPGTTKETLAKLKPAFAADGTTTAGTSSQVSDGAAAVLLARRSVAQKLKLPIIGKWVGAKVVGGTYLSLCTSLVSILHTLRIQFDLTILALVLTVPPEIMGVGPAFAIPAALKKAGLSVSDIDIFEINEAFASQAIMSIQHAKIPAEKVNPQGGAIAIGHPLGVTGARQIATALSRAKKTGEKLIVTSMCIGSGMVRRGFLFSFSLCVTCLFQHVCSLLGYGLYHRQRAIDCCSRICLFSSFPRICTMYIRSSVLSSTRLVMLYHMKKHPKRLVIHSALCY